MAHHRRLATGEAQFVDVSVQAAVFWTGLNAMIAHAIQGKDIERSGTVLQLSTFTTPLVYPCADGEVVLITTTATLDAPDSVADRGRHGELRVGRREDWSTYEARMLTGAGLTHALSEVQEKIRQFCAKHKKAELFARGVAEGVTIAPVNTVADVLALEHLEARRYWQPYRAGERVLRATGAFVKLSRTPVSFSRQAPAVGEHADEIVSSLEPARERAVTTAASATPALPFAGVKIADFSWIGVGPITAKYLADHGATVVRVETVHPADRLRLVGPFKDNVAGPNRCQFFASFNTSKLSLALNLKMPEGFEVAKRLVALGGRLPRLVHGRHDRGSRPRLRGRSRDQPVDHHGEHVPPRADRAGRLARRIRLSRRRDLGLLRDHRLGRPSARRSVQRLHGHDRAALSRRDADGSARSSPAERGRGSTSTRRRWSRRCTSSPRSSSTIR